MITNIIFRRSDSPITSDKPHYENVPFEVPSSWVWTTLGDIAEIITGNTPSKDIKEYYSGNIPFFKPTDLEQGIHTKYSKDRLTPLGFEQSRKLPANSVLVTCIGATIGKTGLTTVEGTCNQQINAIIPTSAILAKFLFYVCISDYMQHEIKANASATTLPILNKANFSKIAITIPPLQEQSRIVKSIEHWLSLVDCIEGNKENLQRTIMEAKSKILTLAIHGKLVPQDSTDEPASELLKRINPKAEITCDNGHYQKLPEGWCECTLGSLFLFIRNGINIHQDKSKIGYPITRIETISSEFIDRSRMGYAAITEDNYSDYYLQKDDILMSHINSPIHVGKCALCDIKAGEKIIHGMNLLCLRPYPDIEAKFILMVFRSPYFKDEIRPFIKNAVNQASINIRNLSSVLLHLPPVSEQHRIVAKIEEIFAQLDAIEASLLPT